MMSLSAESRAKLRKQRQRMEREVEQERELVEAVVRARLRAEGRADLIESPLVQQLLDSICYHLALDLPEDWDLKLPKYLLKKSADHPWAGKTPRTSHELSEAQLRPLAQFLLKLRDTLPTRTDK